MRACHKTSCCCRPSKASSKHLLNVESTDYDDLADASVRGEKTEQSMTQVLSTSFVDIEGPGLSSTLYVGSGPSGGSSDRIGPAQSCSSRAHMGSTLHFVPCLAKPI